MTDSYDYQRMRETFDKDAERYDRARPRYPARMFDDLAAAGVAPGARVLEIGCGTGQATASLIDADYGGHIVKRYLTELRIARRAR